MYLRQWMHRKMPLPMPACAAADKKKRQGKDDHICIDMCANDTRIRIRMRKWVEMTFISFQRDETK